MFSIQPTSKSQRKEHGEHAVRVVSEQAFGPSFDTMKRLQNCFPFRAKIQTSTGDSEGYGRVAYVLCSTEAKKRRAELAIEGESGIATLIDRMRKWVALHSYIYYEMGKNVVSDEAWDRKARQLARLQTVHGHDAGSWHNDTFEGFTDDTGFHLPHTDSIRQKAKELVEDAEES